MCYLSSHRIVIDWRTWLLLATTLPKRTCIYRCKTYILNKFRYNSFCIVIISCNTTAFRNPKRKFEEAEFVLLWEGLRPDQTIKCAFILQNKLVIWKDETQATTKYKIKTDNKNFLCFPPPL